MTGPSDFDRLETERLRRLQECFNADRPQANEIRAALQRWHMSQIRQTRHQPMRTVWVVAGAMLLSGVAMAATRVAQLPAWGSLITWSKPSASAAAAPVSSKRARCFMQRAGRQVECKSAAELRLAAGEKAELIVNDVKTELVGPGVAHLRFEVTSGSWASQFEAQASAAERAVSHPVQAGLVSSSTQVAEQAARDRNAMRRTTVVPAAKPVAPPTAGSSNTAVLPDPSPSPASSLDGAWSRAASALRHGDDVGARAALSEISHGSDPGSRDAALLAQAQLDLAAGRKDTALPLLNELARSGATPFVRQRAQEILARGK